MNDIFLIDFENVHEDGFSGMDKVTGFANVGNAVFAATQAQLVSTLAYSMSVVRPEMTPGLPSTIGLSSFTAGAPSAGISACAPRGISARAIMTTNARAMILLAFFFMVFASPTQILVCIRIHFNYIILFSQAQPLFINLVSFLCKLTGKAASPFILLL